MSGSQSICVGPCALVVVLLSLGLAALCLLPSYQQTEQHALAAWREFKNTMPDENELRLPVMTFNIRLDTLETDPLNHWTQRIDRVAGVLAEYAPFTIGLQEPFAGQVLHLQSKLPAKWRPVGYRQDSPPPYDLGHPSRHHDMKCAILYDDTKLELLHHHYHWLSTTPDVEDSKSFSSFSIRVLNIAHFRLRARPEVELLHFNTHLDVTAEEARRGQAMVARSLIEKYRKHYPRAHVIMTGDFNTAVGQAAYQTLTAPGALTDSWKECERDAGCTIGGSVAMSFHGWQGLHMNTYAARLVASIAFTLYGTGFNLPHAIPTTLRDYVRAALGILQAGPQYSAWEAMPEWPLSRMHVDWILHAPPTAESAATSALAPVFTGVVDVKHSNFSSDHYPILTVFRLDGERAERQKSSVPIE